nr:hypothetical protein [Actinomycetota bacterium]
RRILVAVEDPSSCPERVVERMGRLVRTGGATGIHVAALGGHTALLPAGVRDGFGVRAEMPEMLAGRIRYAENGGDPVEGVVRNTVPRELEEIASRCPASRACGRPRRKDGGPWDRILLTRVLVALGATP